MEKGDFFSPQPILILTRLHFLLASAETWTKDRDQDERRGGQVRSWLDFQTPRSQMCILPTENSKSIWIKVKVKAWKWKWRYEHENRSKRNRSLPWWLDFQTSQSQMCFLATEVEWRYKHESESEGAKMKMKVKVMFQFGHDRISKLLRHKCVFSWMKKLSMLSFIWYW